VKITFIIVALLMTLAALALVVLPMLRSGRRNGRPRHVLVLSVVLVFVLPLAALGLYLHVGAPKALNPASMQAPSNVEQMVQQLRAKLERKPDKRGWLLLAQVYTSQNKLDKARDAYGEALKLDPDNSDLMVAWAETDAMSRADHSVNDRDRELLKKAVKQDPRNERGLWLLGISDYQRGQFADAALAWRRLRVLLKPDSKIAQTVDRQIAMANARAAGKSQQDAMALLNAPAGASSTGTPASDSSANAPADSEGAHIAVHVTVAPDLRARFKPDDTLYVFARAVKGPPMPLAVARLKASALPTTVMLTDGMGMTTNLRLSDAGQVTLTARISHSGQAMPAKGDLEGSTGPVSVHVDTPVDLVIDHTR
jgi:cytochrome c-type biogenesis protein CcmH